MGIQVRVLIRYGRSYSLAIAHRQPQMAYIYLSLLLPLSQTRRLAPHQEMAVSAPIHNS